MHGTLLFGTALAIVAPAAPAAPAPGAPDATPAPARGYAGETSAPASTSGAVRVVPPQAPAKDPTAAADPVAPAPAPAPATATAAPEADAPPIHTRHDPAPDQAEIAALRRRRTVPRLLETLTGWRDTEEARHRTGRITFTPGLQIRNQVGWVSPFTLDRLGNRYEEGVFSSGRVRWRPELAVGRNLKFVAMVDLANGLWAPGSSEDARIQEIYEPAESAAHEGHPPFGRPLRSAYPDFVDPRELYVEARTMLGVIRLGQMSFLWGQGILANDGNNMDRFGDMRFGGDGPGDIQERFLFATKPFGGPIGSDMILALGADLLFRDERADLVRGDLAGQAFAVLRYEPADHPGNWMGGYIVYRGQKSADDGDVYRDDDTLHAGVVDLAGQGTRWLRDDLQLIGAFEGVLIGGRTDVARDEDGTHKILQGGFALRGYIGNHERWLAGFDAGYASGDPNPNDRWINNFTFDAGHRVGLVLFQAVQGWRSARSEVLATDGQLTGVPLNGTQFIPTRGAVTNAIYVHPKARWAFAERFEMWGGPLVAAAATPIVDPYTTNLSGGDPTNSVGGDGTRRFLGTELDLGLRARFDVRNLWLQAGLQGGILLPGAGLANAAGDKGAPVGALWFRTEIRY